MANTSATGPGNRSVEAIEASSKRLGAAYWRLWTADSVSNLADGVLKVALPLIALGYTRSPGQIAGLSFAFSLPWLLFALPAGALVDRADRLHALLAANAVRAVILIPVVAALAFHKGEILALYAVAFCAGSAETVYGTAAQSIVPQLVAREKLPRANGRLFAAELAANEFLGPPLAGLLVAAGATFALASPLGLWIIALGAALTLRGDFRVRNPERRTLRAEVAEGLRFVWHNQLLRTVAMMTAAYNFATSAMLAVLVIYAVGAGSAMGLSQQAYGLLLAAIAAGSVAGAFIAEPVARRLGRTRALALAIPGGALLVSIPAITTNPYLIGAGFFLGGNAVTIWNVVTVSLRQRLTPDRLLGRVNSAYRLLAWGVMPLGAVVAGTLAQLVGVRAVFAITAAVVLTMLTGLRMTTDRRMAEAEREADRESDADRKS
jgi:MFS family permease